MDEARLTQSLKWQRLVRSVERERQRGVSGSEREASMEERERVQ